MKTKLVCLAIILFPATLLAKEITLPEDGILWRTSSLPGYQTTLANCSTCHSAHYAEYQPPNSGKGYWQATVLKMKNVFKAPLAEEDVPAIVEYLTDTYGSNRK